MTAYPCRERSERFGEEETLHLVQEVKDRQVLIYGDGKAAPKRHTVKQAWSEVAAAVSSSSGIIRTADQCRKRYNDVRRRGKHKAATNRQEAAVTGGGPSTSSDLTPAEALASSTLPQASIEGFGGLQIGHEEAGCSRPPSYVEDPRDRQSPPPSPPQPPPPSPPQPPPPPPPRPRPPPPRRRHRATPEDDRRFLEQQQRGFEMLERVLTELNRSTRQLLEPLQRIADSLQQRSQARPPAPAAPSPPPPGPPAPPHHHRRVLQLPLTTTAGSSSTPSPLRGAVARRPSRPRGRPPRRGRKL
ncbi:hypothetical protein WMY93_009237 [Mugilogobius chulae]|uniref:Myb/SANT-like DNA-binding domain-containing protein n=1 Tax=Mugilogobius chulae TaxID=88201 RepID=A0AAW0PK40_9GOBI